jgi:sugar phosphate permease
MIFPNIAASLSRIFYGWRMIGLVSAIRVVGGGIHQYGFTVFFLPISQDLGMSRAATSLAFSLARAQGAIEAPLVGYLIDRFGPRPIIVTAAFLAGAGYILLSWVDSYASFLVVYLAVISLAFIAGFVHSPMVIANSWFIRQRARAMTVVSAAVPVGGAILSPLLAVGVQSLGWRWAAFFSGCLFLAVCLPLSFQVRRSPESMGLLPDGEAPRARDSDAHSMNNIASEPRERDLPAAQAMKTAIFWLLVVSMTARVAAYSTVSVHFVPVMVWQGLAQEEAAFMLGAFAFTTLLDASFPIVWATVGDFYGRKYFATIRGMLSFFYMWGSVAGPVLAGAMYDRSQSYRGVMWIFFFILALATLLNALLIKPWRRCATAAQLNN